MNRVVVETCLLGDPVIAKCQSRQILHPRMRWEIKPQLPAILQTTLKTMRLKGVSVWEGAEVQQLKSCGF